MNNNVILEINQLPSKLLEENPVFKFATRPPGVNFYVGIWKRGDQNKVRLQNGAQSFLIENSISVTAVDEPTSPSEGIVQFIIYSGVASSDLISHDEARRRFTSILKTIRKAGWKKFINEGDPRLIGRDMYKFVLNESPAASMDTDYEPTFEEWMRIPSRTRWSFYANHVYLSVDFSREPTLLDPEKDGAYLVTFTVDSENEHYRSYVEPDKREDWKSALPAQLAILPPMRAKAEAELRAKGVKIDETYQDPPKPNLVR